MQLTVTLHSKWLWNFLQTFPTVFPFLLLNGAIILPFNHLCRCTNSFSFLPQMGPTNHNQGNINQRSKASWCQGWLGRLNFLTIKSLEGWYAIKQRNQTAKSGFSWLEPWLRDQLLDVEYFSSHSQDTEKHYIILEFDITPCLDPKAMFKD